MGQLLDGPADPPWPDERRPAEEGVAAWTGHWRQYTVGFDESADFQAGYAQPAAGVASDALRAPVVTANGWSVRSGAGEPNGQQPALRQWSSETGPQIGGSGGPCDSCVEPAPMLHPGSLRLGWFPRPRFLGLFGTSSERHQGIGRPLDRESWRYRPFSAGWMMGMVQGSPLMGDWAGQKTGFFGGYRFGWDYDHYWGCETRLAFASVELFDSDRAKQAQQAADALLNLPADDPFLNRFDQRRDGQLLLWDVSFLHYPWGDAAWRPYWSIGLGTVNVRFMDRLSRHYSTTKLGMPVALGVKYRSNDWLVFRFEVADNIAFKSGGVDTLHNLSVTGGLEIRFGGTRTVYWPYTPGRHYW